MGPETIGGLLFARVFLRDPNPFYVNFGKKPRKNPNGQVGKRDRKLNLAPPIYQFWATVSYRSTSCGAYEVKSQYLVYIIFGRQSTIPINVHTNADPSPYHQIFFITFAAGSAPAGDRLFDLTLEGRGPAVNVLMCCFMSECRIISCAPSFSSVLKTCRCYTSHWIGTHQ